MAYCPICRTEYEAGAGYCESCRSSLVDTLPEGTELVELAVFPNVPSAEMIREILEKNQIQTIQRGEVDPIGVTSGAEPVTLLVEERHLQRARELYDAYFAGAGQEQSDPRQE